jgi:hypothetical protein
MAKLQGSLGFYEADFVKARGEKSFSLSFCLVLAAFWQQLSCPALVLDHCGARHERRNDQTPKSVTL